MDFGRYRARQVKRIERGRKSERKKKSREKKGSLPGDP